MFYMDSICGVGFEPEHYVDISSVIDIKTEMLDCHISQNDWLIELFDDTPSNMMSDLVREGRQRRFQKN